MRCFYRFRMYAAHALYMRAPYVTELRWPPRVRGMYAVHTPLALWIHNGQVLLRDIIRSGIAIHTPYVPHVRHPCAIDTQLIRNTCEIVAPEMFHQTISAMLLRICSFSRTLYERHGIAGQWNRGITLPLSLIICLRIQLIDLRTAQVYWDAIFWVSQEVYLNFHHFCG